MPATNKNYYISPPTPKQSRYRRLWVPKLDPAVHNIVIKMDPAPRGITSYWKLKYFIVWLDTSANVGNRYILADIRSEDPVSGRDDPIYGLQTGQVPANYYTAIKILPGSYISAQVPATPTLSIYEANAAGHASMPDLIITSNDYFRGLITSPLASDLIWADIMLEYRNDIEGITEQ